MSAPSTANAASSACWSCGATTNGAHFCPACKKIQPLPRGTDYFTFFGLSQKLRLDSAELEQRFHQLSWKLHPDNFVRASEDERGLSLARSSELNDAYRALREPLSRTEHLLAHEGVRNEGQQKQKAPPELLAEVFELNESLDELREARTSAGNDKAGGDVAAVASIRAKLTVAEKDFTEKLEEADQQLETIAGEWDAAIDAGVPVAERRAMMTRMNEVLNRRSYIRNLVNKVTEELALA